MGQPRDEAAEDTLLQGVPFRRWTEAGAVAEILAASARGEGGWVVTPNLSILRGLTQDAALRQLVRPAVLVADGMPLVWASRLQHRPLPERVAGSSLVWTLSEGAAATGRSIYLLGDAPGVADRAARVLLDRFPELVVAGTDSPPFGAEATAEGFAAIRDRLLEGRPDVVFCAFGFPKQERLTERLRVDLPQAWFIGCGAGIAFVAGVVPRAPGWMQKAGVEWVFRLSREPRRLYRRYAADIPFALRLLWSARAERKRSA